MEKTYKAAIDLAQVIGLRRGGGESGVKHTGSSKVYLPLRRTENSLEWETWKREKPVAELVVLLVASGDLVFEIAICRSSILLLRLQTSDFIYKRSLGELQ